MLRLARGDHHGVLDVFGPKQLGLAPRRHARGRVDPVGELRVRVDVLGDPRLCDPDSPASRAEPPPERLNVHAPDVPVGFGWEKGRGSLHSYRRGFLSIGGFLVPEQRFQAFHVSALD